jgi:hypothetical protein
MGEGDGGIWFSDWPHFRQKTSLSELWVPHLEQYIGVFLLQGCATLPGEIIVLMIIRLDLFLLLFSNNDISCCSCCKVI